MNHFIVLTAEDFAVDPCSPTSPLSPPTNFPSKRGFSSKKSFKNKKSIATPPSASSPSPSTPTSPSEPQHEQQQLQQPLTTPQYTKFKYYENEYFEFKETICMKSFPKYIETLCGFLNNTTTGGGGEGGYLIFGIRDNRDLIGLQMNEKEIDQFICRIDGITSMGLILQQLSDSSSSDPNSLITTESTTQSAISILKIPPNMIRTTRYVNNLKQKFLVVRVCPPPLTTITTNSTVKYQCANGMIFYRLGASNYFEKAEKLYRQSDYEMAMKQIEQKLHQENQQNIQLFAKTLQEKNQSIQQLQKQMEESSAQLVKANQLASIYQIHLQRALEKVMTPSFYSSSAPSTQISREGSNEAIAMIHSIYHNTMDWFFHCFK